MFCRCQLLSNMNYLGEMTNRSYILIVFMFSFFVSTISTQDKSSFSNHNHSSLGVQEGNPASWEINSPEATTTQDRPPSTSIRPGIPTTSHGLRSSTYTSSGHDPSSTNFDIFNNHTDNSRSTDVTVSIQGHGNPADTSSQGSGPASTHTLIPLVRINTTSKPPDLSNSSTGFDSDTYSGSHSKNIVFPALVNRSLNTRMAEQPDHQLHWLVPTNNKNVDSGLDFNISKVDRKEQVDTNNRTTHDIVNSTVTSNNNLARITNNDALSNSGRTLNVALSGQHDDNLHSKTEDGHETANKDISMKLSLASHRTILPTNSNKENIILEPIATAFTSEDLPSLSLSSEKLLSKGSEGSEKSTVPGERSFPASAGFTSNYISPIPGTSTDIWTTTKTVGSAFQPLTDVLPSRPSGEKSKNSKRSTFPHDVPQLSDDLIFTFSPSSQATSTEPAATTKTTQGFLHRFQSDIATSQTAGDLLQEMESLNHEDQNGWVSGNTDKPSMENSLNIGHLVKHTDVKNDSELIDPALERDMLTWLDNLNPGLGKSPENAQSSNASNLEHENRTSIVRSSPGQLGLCAEDCSKSKGVCVMGNDFKPHCVVVSDACEQFRCVNGDCVSTDGRYRCECHQGWVGPFCDKPCTLDCGDNGFCGRLDDNDTLGCICHWNYTGNRCQDKRKIVSAMIELIQPGNEFKTWEIAVVSGLAAVILALMSALLPYLLWRRQCIPMRKLVFYFQEYEDDDDKEYDAFISYKSTASDERFILHHLYPKLEKELNFKLCLHFRDFPPGEPIANNIIRAIEGSRRTILILSPSFVSSEWCRMEYQKAQYEMLKLKHKIIPIIIEDISAVTEIDKNLKCIINTVTYITWPGDEESTSSKRLAKFWKLLELSMPKRRSESNQSSSTTELCSGEVPLTPVSHSSTDSILSSSNGDDFHDSSTSISDSSDLNDSIRKTDNTENFNGFKISTISEHTFPDALPSHTGKACTVSSQSPQISRHETTVLKNSGTDVPKEGSSDRSSSAPYNMVGSANNRTTSLDNCPKHNIPDGHGNGPSNNRRTDNSGLENQQKNRFLSSDDHIVEIRQTRPGGSGITVKPRPRQFSDQFFV